MRVFTRFSRGRALRSIVRVSSIARGSKVCCACVFDNKFDYKIHIAHSTIASLQSRKWRCVRVIHMHATAPAASSQPQQSPASQHHVTGFFACGSRTERAQIETRGHGICCVVRCVVLSAAAVVLTSACKSRNYWLCLGSPATWELFCIRQTSLIGAICTYLEHFFCTQQRAFTHMSDIFLSPLSAACAKLSGNARSRRSLNTKKNAIIIINTYIISHSAHF